MMKNVIITLMAMLTLPLFSCSDELQEGNNVPKTRVDVVLNDVESRLATGQQNFAFKFFNTVMADMKGGNLVYSPLSLSLNLSLDANGVDEIAKDEIVKTVAGDSFGADDLNSLNAFNKQLMAQLKDVDNTILFMPANSVWNHNNYELKDSFKNTCKSFYDAYSFSVDMNDDETASKINSWISENTKGLLNDIFKPGETRNHSLMTINTIYFKGLWKEIFDRAKTKQELFRNLDGREVWVDMMKGTQYSRYYFGEDYSVASIAYGNEAYSLYIILPKDIDKLNDLCKNISRDEWRSIKDNTTASNVMWNLPRFEFKGNTINYTDYLKDCGINRMFEVGLNDAFIDGIESNASIFQTVYVKVDEDGTEGAAETHTGITTGTSATPEMIVDKPFLFIIEEQSSGSILFMGKITEL